MSLPHMTEKVLPFQTVPQLEPQQRADLLQWAEAERAKCLADAIACFAFGKEITGTLSLEKTALCQKLGALALRSAKPEWVTAAMKHAVEECTDVLAADVVVLIDLVESDREAIAEVLVPRVLQAYLGILDGSIVLPAATYLSITKDAVI